MEKHYNIIDYQYLLILTVTEEESEALYEICFDLITCNIINEKPVLQSKTKPMLFHVDISQIESRYNEVITDGYSLTDIKEYIKQHIELNDKTVIILDDTNYEQLFEEFGCDIIPITMFTQILNPYDENPKDIRAIGFSANGDVLDGNVYQKGILEIINDYQDHGKWKIWVPDIWLSIFIKWVEILVVSLMEKIMAFIM